MKDLCNPDFKKWHATRCIWTSGIFVLSSFLIGAISFGQSLVFDGVNDFVQISNSEFAAANYTIEGWIKTSASSTQQVIIDAYPIGSNGTSTYVEVQVDGTLRFLHRQPPSTGGGENVYSSSTVNNGNWIHFAAVKDEDNKLRLYINGVLEATSANVVDNINNALDINLGRNHGGIRYHQGQLDDIRLWNVARSAEQINITKDTELSGNESGLYSYYKFDNNSSCEAEDCSPNNKAGTINGSTFSLESVSIQDVLCGLITYQFTGPGSDPTEEANWIGNCKPNTNVSNPLEITININSTFNGVGSYNWNLSNNGTLSPGNTN